MTVILAGMIISALMIMKLLAWLAVLYAHLTGGTGEIIVRAPWPGKPGRVTTPLDAVLVIAVLVTMLVTAIWFFFFASSR